MAELKLAVTKRAETGKGSARRSRAAGKIPAVLYGAGMETIAVEVERRELVGALKTDAGMNILLDIEIDGETTLALTRELQRDPVRGTLLHADFVKIDRTVEIEVEVPVHLVGESPGVKEGGVLEHPLFTVHVRCLPTNVPENVEADISTLNIGDSLRVSDLSRGEFTITNDPESVVAAVAAPISEEELEAMEAEAGIEQEPTEAELAAAAEEAEAVEAEGEEGEGPEEREAPAEPNAEQ
jgi:large subunit ribosomal protein L25